MILIKDKLQYKIKKFVIHYYKIESINDFSFLTILLANKAIDEDKNLQELFKDFTKGNNDYYLLLCKRFEKLFKEKVENFINIKDAIVNSMEQKKQFIVSSEDLLINYNEYLDMFLYEKIYWNEKELIEHISKRYNSETKKYIGIEIFDEENKNSEILEEFHLSLDLSYFNLRNLNNLNIESILNSLIEDVKEKSYNFLPDNNESIVINIDKFNSVLKQIERDYKKGRSPFIELINFEDQINEFKNKFKLELNLRNNIDELIISWMYKYKSVPFVREERMSFSEFKLKDFYKKVLNSIFSNFENVNNKFKELIIKYSNTLEELELIYKFIDCKININDTLNKIDLMIEKNYDFINDVNFIENDMYDLMIKSRFKDYYKYIHKFHAKLIDNMVENKKVSLLSEIRLNDSKLLREEDSEWINEFISNKRKIYDQIKERANKFTGERGFMDKINKKIVEHKNNPDNEMISQSILNEVNFWRNTVNFFAHFTQETTKNDRKNQEKVFSRYDKLKDIKERYLKIKINDYNTYDISLKDLNYLDKIIEDFNKFKIQIEKI